MVWVKVPVPTPEALEAALAAFDAHHRNTPEWAGWETSKAHRFAVQRGGKLYPSKMVLQLAAGTHRSKFSGGMETGQAGAVLKAAGAEVVDLKAPNTKGTPPRYWALFAVPTKYRILDAIDAGILDRWTTAGKPIREGDGVVIWQGRDEKGRRGVVALGQVIGAPEVMADAENPCWVDTADGRAERQRVGVQYLRLKSPLWVGGVADPLLKRLSISRARGGTVFHVSTKEWEDLIAHLEPGQRLEMASPATALQETGERAGTGQGYGLTAAERKAVELRAMALARAHFETIFDKVEDVSASHSFDLRCWTNGTEHRVEVKGTTGDGSSILLTANEVENARKFYPLVSLFIVHGIRLADGKALGGEAAITSPWDVDAGALTPTVFRWSMS